VADRIACNPGFRPGQHPVFAEQTIGERGLAAVGAADDRDGDGPRLVRGVHIRWRRGGVPGSDHCLDIADPEAMLGGDRDRFAEPEFEPFDRLRR